MRVKSYFAASVASAMQKARAELGEDAMLLDSRPASPEARHLGAYEVVFALAPAANSHDHQLDATSERGVSGELSELRRKFERMSDYMMRLSTVPSQENSNVPRSPGAGRVYSELLSHDFSPRFIQELSASIFASHAAALPSPQGNAAGGIPREICRRIPLKEDALSPRDLSRTPKVVALIGPPGAGKTSTLAKLAFEYGLKRRRPVQVLSFDVLRVAASEQLRSYCAVLGVGFQALESPRHLGIALSEHKAKSLILIDTPGVATGERDILHEFAEVFRVYPQIDVYLVLSALVKSADLQSAVDRFGIAKPSCLIATHIDETFSAGGVLSVAATSRLPIAFFGSGQVVPEDIVPACTQFLETLIGRLGLQELTVAREAGPYAERAVAG